MGKENAVSRPFTRALASALRASGGTSTTHNQQRANTKRPASEDNNITEPPNKKKKRVVLGDISNVVGFNAAKLEAKNIKQVKNGSAVTSDVTDDTDDNCTEKWSLRLPPRPLERSASTVGKSDVIGSSTELDISKVINIDSEDSDPLLCCLYAPEIYYNLRVSELKRRPVPDFMERTQKDVTQSMRGILVDWLVEVSEEYTLVPDTLYLTVYLIDWFLHGNYLERQSLQLLGITCMLIASKYEEITAPRVEEFCLMTDNTYTRDQVLEMENQVLAHFSFQVYTPTPKTFLRRFLRAAQASYMSQRLELEFLASYLTELTLIDGHFLKFLPSVIAASAVFLAKWTLDQSNHPWNPTLEHYTTYKASDLKASVYALQDLQLNTRGCPLSSIRMKYRQEKFKSVAVLISPKLLDTLF
ncbi:unnamed protein product [Eruca vesicaria subsp. sativa]|uniref:Uncharacterized protein n=1 Tax=Eruca vesicaria subsp. sativa TaxID=29727 RepID=A0ABC8LG60_ERUVS|nr:unnamed protein product [Eruca vesicaria subsp. sativa]